VEEQTIKHYKCHTYLYVIYTLSHINVFSWQFHIGLNRAYTNWKEAFNLTWDWAMQSWWHYAGTGSVGLHNAELVALCSNSVCSTVCSPKIKKKFCTCLHFLSLLSVQKHLKISKYLWKYVLLFTSGITYMQYSKQLLFTVFVINGN
jgi:hypothetical protein